MTKKRLHKVPQDIDPDEIFLDDRNIPEFNVHQFEGRIESPIKKRVIVIVGIFFAVIECVFLWHIGKLQIAQGEFYANKSEQNTLLHQILFPERGIIYDRNNVELAWNISPPEELGFFLRNYIKDSGFGHVLGYLHYPARDKMGVYYRKDYEANVGVEAVYNDELKGKSGLRIIETDALGNIVSQSVIDPPIPGKSLMLSIDARVQKKLYESIQTVARTQDYMGGAGAIMDITNGEILALTSYPEFDSNIMTSGDDSEKIASYNTDKKTPFLNRVSRGLYTPGSIVKPIYALGALNEGIITPEKQILSTGSISIPNPYDPNKGTVFMDWKAHGWLDMRSAIAWSSNVYFYEIAGGYKDQKGLGVQRQEKYARLFGFGTSTGIDLTSEEVGTIPNPEWKAEKFNGDPWRIGDTYFTGIGQYGVQVTPLQALREAAIIASKGNVVTPRLVRDRTVPPARIPIPESYFTVIQEGMRKGVREGTASVLNMSGVHVAAKTGTAELGVSKTRVNSWVIGFFPYEKPRYAFAIVMERGVKGNTTNASIVARNVLSWIASSTPEYVNADW